MVSSLTTFIMKNCLDLFALCCIVLLMRFVNRLSCFNGLQYVKVSIMCVMDDWHLL